MNISINNDHLASNCNRALVYSFQLIKKTFMAYLANGVYKSEVKIVSGCLQYILLGLCVDWIGTEKNLVDCNDNVSRELELRHY